MNVDDKINRFLRIFLVLAIIITTIGVAYSAWFDVYRLPLWLIGWVLAVFVLMVVDLCIWIDERGGRGV